MTFRGDREHEVSVYDLVVRPRLEFTVMDDLHGKYDKVYCKKRKRNGRAYRFCLAEGRERLRQ